MFKNLILEDYNFEERKKYSQRLVYANSSKWVACCTSTN